VALWLTICPNVVWSDLGCRYFAQAAIGRNGANLDERYNKMWIRWELM